MKRCPLVSGKNYFGVMHNYFQVLGGMAGSSMDGLDLAVSRFFMVANRWEYDIIKAQTIQYPDDLFQKLKDATDASEGEKKRINKEFGEWIGNVSAGFLAKDSVDLAAIHGHTVIHRPKEGISWQLGDGEVIANLLGVPTITDFRSRDVELGGQGAPLVPFGDFLLFGNYDACLNLGGIANISVQKEKLAWDISPCNQVLNHFAQRMGKVYDFEGSIARSGNFDQSFFDAVSSISYFSLHAPKSLPNQFISPKMLDTVSPVDGAHTFAHFLANQLHADLIPFPQVRKLLITGGGALNKFLVDTIKKKLEGIACVVPERTLVDFKEALIFSFLGMRSYRREINTLASVTGAREDSCGGVIHLPK